VTAAFGQAGDTIVLVGETLDELGGSEYLKLMYGLVAGHPPALDLELERAVQAAVREAVRRGLLVSAHDCSEGGIAVALAESCVAAGIGALVELDDDLPAVASLFSESQSRIVVSVGTEQIEDLFDLLAAREVPYSVIGEVGGEQLVINVEGDYIRVALDEITDAYNHSLQRMLSE
jgi:phosphoribosylformylglycinamidine synthase